MPAPKHHEIELVITDLDNTLYDWVTFFVQSFYDMLSVATGLLGADEEQLVRELRVVHQRHHNSEHPFALLETDIVKRTWPDADRRQLAALLDPAFHAFNSTRKRTLVAYPGVVDTLNELSRTGVPVVGHTEATVPNALFRLNSLGLAPLLRKLYAAEPTGDSHPNPTGAELTAKSELPVRYLGLDERKPDPRIIFDICKEFSVPPRRTLYIGDSISRDIGMAAEAGALSAWARYGTKFEKRFWEQLVRVTHWTADDVKRAEVAQARYGQTKPDLVLEESFSEILENCEFASASS
jgi:phosphoglycolate phosphatase